MHYISLLFGLKLNLSQVSISNGTEYIQKYTHTHIYPNKKSDAKKL